MANKRGRPSIPAHERKAKRIDVRADAEEKGRMEQAADIAGMKLSDWIRQTLDSAAKRAIKSQVNTK